MVKKQRALTRFRCGHCATRLIMHDRHLGRVVACHGCGRPTHPVASRLARLHQPTAVAPTPGKAKSNSTRRGGPACANCGESLGKLQVRRVWHDETVCQPCFTTLDAERARLAPREPFAPAPAGARRAAVGRADRGGTTSYPPAPHLSAAPVLLIGAACVGFFFALSVMSYVGGFAVGLALVAAAAVGVRWLRRRTSSVRARFDQMADVRRRYGTQHAASMLVSWCRAQPAGRLPYALLVLAFWGLLYVPYRLGGLLLHGPRPSSVARLPA